MAAGAAGQSLRRTPEPQPGCCGGMGCLSFWGRWNTGVKLIRTVQTGYRAELRISWAANGRILRRLVPSVLSPTWHRPMHCIARFMSTPPIQHSRGSGSVARIRPGAGRLFDPYLGSLSPTKTFQLSCSLPLASATLCQVQDFQCSIPLQSCDAFASPGLCRETASDEEHHAALGVFAPLPSTCQHTRPQIAAY